MNFYKPDLELDKRGHIVYDDNNKPRKYLIIWSLVLNAQELQKLSMRPEALAKGLSYMENIKKGSKMELYRIVPMDEITKFEGTPHNSPEAQVSSRHPNGIAIVEAGSIEAARKMITGWIEGLSYGGMSIQRYVKYEIKPLMEIGQEGGRR